MTTTHSKVMLPDSLIKTSQHLKTTYLVAKKSGRNYQAGNALETFLGVPENNIKGTDYMGIGLKVSCSDAMTNLFSQEPDDCLNHWKSIILRHCGTGYVDVGGKTCTKHGLQIHIDDNKDIHLFMYDTCLATWRYDTIVSRIENTIPVIALFKGNMVGNQYHHKTMYQIRLTADTLIHDIKSNKAKICTRIGAQGHDHGTGFRINTKTLISHSSFND